MTICWVAGLFTDRPAAKCLQLAARGAEQQAARRAQAGLQAAVGDGLSAYHPPVHSRPSVESQS